MLRRTSLRFLTLFVLAAAIPVVYLAAQETQDTQSVAEAARRAREKKDAAATKPAKVVTNDTLPAAAKPAVNAPESANTAPASAPSAAAQSDSAAPAASTQLQAAPGSEEKTAASTGDVDKAKAEVDSLKKEIAEKQASVDLLLRELGLEQDTFYSKQDYQRDAATKQKLDSLQSDAKAQQDLLNELKAKLIELAGADALKPAPTNPPTTPAQPQP